jgi:hypothetical protein
MPMKAEIHGCYKFNSSLGNKYAVYRHILGVKIEFTVKFKGFELYCVNTMLFR